MKGIFGKRHGGEGKRKPTCAVFAVPLNDVCAREEAEIPLIAEELIDYLEQRLDVEGMFRIPGNSVKLEELKAYYDGQSEEDIDLDTYEDVHAVACLLKLYLRELPDPLLSHRFYDTFIAVQKNPDVHYRLTNLRKLISALPVHNKYLLTRLIQFLIKVAARASVNKMSEPNLAIVFGPNLLRPRHESMLRMIEDARHVNGVICLLLEEHEYLVTFTAEKPKNTSFSEPSPNTPTISEVDTERKPEHPSADVVQYDLDNPYKYAEGYLKRVREEAERPSEVAKMNALQLREEKLSVKRVLRNFDIAFKSVQGRLPNKQEKEPLRPLYESYRQLSQKVEDLGAVEEMMAPVGEVPPNKDIEELKKEKKQLQLHLHQYQKDFMRRYGRTVQFLEDRLPVQAEYARYKELRSLLSTLSKTQGSSDGDLKAELLAQLEEEAGDGSSVDARTVSSLCDGGEVDELVEAAAAVALP